MTTCCTRDNEVEWPRAASDYLLGTITLEGNTPINDQAVAITFNGGTTYVDAEWQGAAGMTRDWMAYITPDLLPAAITVEVLTRITDTTDPDHPISAFIESGTITFT